MSAPDARPLRWTILTPVLRRPAGGLFALYQHANALAALPHQRVQIVHMPSHEAVIASVGDIPWFDFDPRVEHVFPATLDTGLLPDADVLLYTVKVVAIALDRRSGPGGVELVQHLQGPATRTGAPLVFVQALAVFPPSAELTSLQGVGPKVCVAKWMVDRLVRAGLPADDVVHVPNGLDHHLFRVRRPIAERTGGVAMNYNPHPLKNMDEALAALERCSRELDLPVTLFGTALPPLAPDSGIRFIRSPGQRELAETIYDRASIYLQPSTQEGFGLCATEAMACGCALVTTDNGGSDDYAVDGLTAAMCGTGADEMFDVIAELVRDDARRVRIAEQGVARAQELRWDLSARLLRTVALDYLAQPSPRSTAGLALDESLLRLER